jgi:hypothetical protein
VPTKEIALRSASPDAYASNPPHLNGMGVVHEPVELTTPRCVTSFRASTSMVGAGRTGTSPVRPAPWILTGCCSDPH